MGMRFKDYIVCVVGGTGGIGFSIVQGFLEEGAVVYIHGRDQDKLTSRLKTLSHYGERVRGIQADLVSEDDRKRFLLEINRIDKLDVLICAVGNGNVVRGSDLTEDDWGVVLGQNFLTSSLIVPSCVEKLTLSTNASICFIGSIVSEAYLKAPISYAVSKAAVTTYSKYLSFELASKSIRVNCVQPGNILFEGGRWEQLRNDDVNGVDMYIKNEVPLKRFGTTKEVASAVLFLSSQEASFITGSSLVVDGGQLKNI